VTETPVGVDAGLSAKRDRRWGLLGGLVGGAVGLGSAAIAIFVEGADLVEGGPYPAFFAKRQLLVYDVFLALVVSAGAVFAISGIVLARRSSFPRTDAFGALLLSAILTVLGAALLFTRLVAVIRGA